MISPAKHQHILRLLASSLPADDRPIVLGDLQEEGAGLISSVAAILGYAVRKELVSWAHWESWLVLMAVAAPLGVMLGSASLGIADGSAISVWYFASNWDFSLLQQASFWTLLIENLPSLAWSVMALLCWGWCCGALMGAVSPKTIRSTSLMICLFFAAQWTGWRPPTIDLQPLHLARDFRSNAAAFRTPFYRDLFSPFVQLLLVVAPMLFGLRTAGHRMPKDAWMRRVFWVLVGLALFSLASRSSAWWLMHTWTTFPAPTHRLPSLLPLALSGGLAWLVAKRTASTDAGSKRRRPITYA
jgi:hypothetical protein